MKLFYCRDCLAMVTIGDFARTCACSHSLAKKLQGTKVVQVEGPCSVFALQDRELREGGGKYWRVKEPNKEIRRLKSPIDTHRDAAEYRDKQARLKRKENAEAQGGN